MDVELTNNENYILSKIQIFKDRRDVDFMGKQFFEEMAERAISQNADSHNLAIGLIRHEWQEGRLYSYATGVPVENNPDLQGVRIEHVPSD